MFAKGARVVTFNGPRKNPNIDKLTEHLMPSSAYWIRGVVESDNGQTLKLTDVERNSYITGCGSSHHFGSGRHWFSSTEENGLTLPSRNFEDDTNLKKSSERRLVL